MTCLLRTVTTETILTRTIIDDAMARNETLMRTIINDNVFNKNGTNKTLARSIIGDKFYKNYNK